MTLLSTLEKKLNLPSPSINLFESQYSDYQIFIKREDLIHPYISGNKWRKLKFNLLHYLKSNHDGIVSVGGAFSNHLVALAAACYKLHIPVVGIVRGEELDKGNPTLNLCEKLGMKVVRVSFDEYASRYDDDFISKFSTFQNPYFIAEGGSNELHLEGCREILQELQFNPDFIVLPLGTGGTASALCQFESKVIAISPFKEAKVKIPFLSKISFPHQVIFDYALNGYGRYNKEVVQYINSFWEQFQIPLDPIYNAKGMMGLEDLMKTNFFPRGSKILYLHTGGLQGIAGFNMLHGHRERIKIPRNIYFPEVDL
jgi:1-aminocyclopropane-1-carboxylate deaminase